MLALGALGCALVCLCGGMAMPVQARRDGRLLVLAAVQLAGGMLLGWLVGWVMGLTPAETAALVLVGAAPGAAGAVPLAALAGGDATLAQGTAAIGSFAGLAATAVIAAGAGGGALWWLVLAAALPTWAGMGLRGRLWPGIARTLSIAAGLALGAMIVAALVLGTAGAEPWPLAGAALVMAAALSVLGHAAGQAIGGTAGAASGAAVLTMRNVAVPMLAGFAAGMPAAPLAAGAFGIAMYLPVLALVFAKARRARP